MEEDTKESVDRENMLEYAASIQKSIESGRVEAVFSVAQLTNGGWETAFIGKLDPFSMLGFTMFLQIRKLIEVVPSERDIVPDILSQDKGGVLQ